MRDAQQQQQEQQQDDPAATSSSSSSAMFWSRSEGVYFSYKARFKIFQALNYHAMYFFCAQLWGLFPVFFYFFFAILFIFSMDLKLDLLI